MFGNLTAINLKSNPAKEAKHISLNSQNHKVTNEYRVNWHFRPHDNQVSQLATVTYPARPATVNIRLWGDYSAVGRIQSSVPLCCRPSLESSKCRYAKSVWSWGNKTIALQMGQDTSRVVLLSLVSLKRHFSLNCDSPQLQLGSQMPCSYVDYVSLDFWPKIRIQSKRKISWNH